MDLLLFSNLPCEKLFQGIYRCLLNTKTLAVCFDEAVASVHIGRIGCDGGSGIAMENIRSQEILQGLTVLFADTLCSQQSHTPGTALTGCLHDGNRCVDGSSEHALSHNGCLEITAVSVDAVQSDMFFF